MVSRSWPALTGLALAWVSLSLAPSVEELGVRAVASLRMAGRFQGRLSGVAPAVQRVPWQDLRPEWMQRQGLALHQVEANSSNYARSGKTPAALDETEQDAFLGLSALKSSMEAEPGSGQGRLQNQIRARFDTLKHEREVREMQGLLGQQHQYDWLRQNQAMGQAFLRSLISLQIRDSLQKAEKRSPQVAAVAQVHKKIDRAIVSGVSMQTKSGVKVGTRADLPRQMGRIWMTSPLLNGAVDFRVGRGDNGFNEAGAGEAVRVVVDRELPWSLRSGMVYGGTSRTVTAQLSRPIVPNLMCSIENRQDFSKGFAEGFVDARTEQTARINYQVSF